MKRGRSKFLIEKRDKKLIERYYYWTELERMRFDDAIKIVSEEEFFISEICVISIIRRGDKYFNELIKKQPSKKALQLFKESV